MGLSERKNFLTWEACLVELKKRKLTDQLNAFRILLCKNLNMVSVGEFEEAPLGWPEDGLDSKVFRELLNSVEKLVAGEKNLQAFLEDESLMQQFLNTGGKKEEFAHVMMTNY